MDDQISLFPEERKNTGLFSQYYLDEILVPSFGTIVGDTYFREKFEILEPIIAKNLKITAKRNEAQIQKDLIDPILDTVLGFKECYDVQLRQKNDVPDYVLFSSAEKLEHSKNLDKGSEEFRDLSIGVIDAKAWKESKSIASDANISQIFRYLSNYSKRWGVLTNGYRWLLFANKPGIRQDQYIEFDLRKIIQDNTSGAAGKNFRLFIYLLRRESFEWQPGTTSELDKVLEQSIQNAAKLQTDLKGKVYEAFELVAKEYQRFENLTLDSEEKIQALKEASLIFLYRILFLLFGESRLILPIRKEDPYYALSLEKLLVDQVYRDPRALPNSTRYWAALQELFRLIHGLEDNGSSLRLREDIGLPAYNGGLFDPKKYENVSKWRLGDDTIRKVMNLLTKTAASKKKEDTRPVRVSYRDLGVQHLGNIYEGILENHVHVKEDGSIEILNDKKKRKATGSYYTPDYIVDYIVKETLQPIVDNAKKENNAKEAILRITVLDPAMGSGHFLVGAIDYLAEELAAISHEEGLYTEAELQESRRQIAERCIYGVDINEMAVELAKLSIWLHTISKDKPLTFLDNRIKCGNSLIGVSQEHKTSPSESDEPNLFPASKLIPEVKHWLWEGKFFSTPSDNIDIVKHKEGLDRELRDHRLKYKHLADLWIARYFMSENEAEITVLRNKLSEEIVVNAMESSEPKPAIYTKALKIADEKHFFHWELEFPEIFFDEFGRRKVDDAGFDAVVGNPPYSTVTQDVLKGYYDQNYEVVEGRYDTFELFFERGYFLLKQGGIHGYIVPSPMLTNVYSRRLRRFFLEKTSIREINNFKMDVFDEPTVHTCILLYGKPFTQTNSIKIRNRIKEPHGLTSPYDFEVAQSSVGLNENAVFDIFLDVEANNLISRMMQVSSSLGELCFIRQCIKTGDDAQYVISSSTHPGNDWKPSLRGKSIQRYSTLEDDLYLKYGEWLARNWKNKSFYETPKIAVRETGDRITAALDLDNRYFLSSLYSLYPKDSKNVNFLKPLLAILNSRIATYFISLIAFELTEGAFTKIRTNQLERLPICIITFTTPKKTREKLTRQLISLSEKAIGSVSVIEDNEAIQKQLQPVIELANTYSEEENDVLHDFLAHLAEQMLAMNKGKQERAKEFFEWMDDYGLPSREVRQPKGFLDNFWKKDFKVVLAHLKKNKARLKIEDENRLKGRFVESSKALNDLDKKIEHTDWLIDQVVYALYGLTDEEIAIVERG